MQEVDAKVLEAGMKDMSEKFNEVGAKVYIDATGLESVRKP